MTGFPSNFTVAFPSCVANYSATNNNNNSNNIQYNVYGAVIVRKFTVHFVNVERCQASADPRQARRLRLSVRLYRLLESTPTIAIYYYYMQ